MQDLFEISFDASRKYIISHIESERHKKAFEEEAEYISQIVRVATTLEDLEEKLIEYKEIVEEQVNSKSFWTRDISDFFSNDSKYALLAYDQALDVARSLKTRFVTGGYGTKFHYLPK